MSSKKRDRVERSIIVGVLVTVALTALRWLFDIHLTWWLPTVIGFASGWLLGRIDSRLARGRPVD